MLWIKFVNSLARDPLGHDPARDRLNDPDWLEKFADQWRLQPRRLRAAADRDRLHRFRSVLERCVNALIAGQSLAPRDVTTINRHLSAKPVKPTLEQHQNKRQMQLTSQAAGVDAWLFRIAISFVDFLVNSDPLRLKLCDNPDCCWVFYDATRSRTRRWCAVGCGDLIKVREFRQRQKKEGR